MFGRNTPLSVQIEALHQALRTNRPLYHVLEASENLHVPDYYIGAGCIAQTVWNQQSGNLPEWGINDIDFVYFDEDVSLESESAVIDAIRGRFPDCPLRIDVKNQARVHLWYRDHFGYDIAPYQSVESAINTWPTTATAVGVRLCDGTLQVYAPYGLTDLFSQIVRPNKVQITREIYEKKAHRWIRTWPSLTVIPW